jgi:hypothetical protein
MYSYCTYGNNCIWLSATPRHPYIDLDNEFFPCVSVTIVQGRLFGHDGLPITENGWVSYGMLRCQNVAAIALLTSKALIHEEYIIDKPIEDS